MIDVLASGADPTRLPMALADEAPFDGSTEQLPGLFEGQGKHLQEWTSASQSGYLQAGRARLRKKDLMAARGSFASARIFDRDKAEPQIGLIQIALLTGQYHRSAQMIRELCRRSSGFISKPFDVKAWHGTEENYDEFLSRFRREVADTSNANETMRALMAYVAWTAGNRDRALDQFKRAASDVPQETGWVNVIRVLESPSETKLPPVGMGGTASGGQLPSGG